MLSLLEDMPPLFSPSKLSPHNISVCERMVISSAEENIFPSSYES